MAGLPPSHSAPASHATAHPNLGPPGATRLTRLDLRACEHLRGTGLTQLARLAALRELNLRGCYG